MDLMYNTQGSAPLEQPSETTRLLLQRGVHAAVASIVVTDARLPGNPIVYHNPAFEHTCGYAANEIEGRSLRFLQGVDTNPATIAEIRYAITQGKSCHVVIQNYRKDGTAFWNELEISPMRDDSGMVTHFVGVQSDVTRRVEAEQERDALQEQQRHIAETLQRALLLTPPSATLNGLEVSTQYLPASDEAVIGGDFFDTISLTKNQVALVVGDCTGKGLKAAQYTAEVKYALRALLREYGSPAPALTRLNCFLIDSQRLDGRPSDAFVCVSVAIIDTRTGGVCVACAGMEPPLVVRADGVTESLPLGGVLLGVDETANYDTARMILGTGDTLIMVTDGITEAHSPRPRREMFGYDGLTEAARHAAVDAVPIEAMGERIVAAAKAFVQGRLDDDVCVLLARRTGTNSDDLFTDRLVPSLFNREGFLSPHHRILPAPDPLWK